MNRTSLLAVGAALLGAAALHGQSSSTSSAPAPTPAVKQPALVSSVTVTDNDSPLVRAAKATTAARIREAKRSTGVVITDAYLKNHPGATISQATENKNTAPAAKPHVKTEAEYETVGPKPKVVDPTVAAKKQEAVRAQIERLNTATEDPTGGDNMDQEQAERRLGQIAKETQPADQQPKSIPPPEYRKP